MLFECPPYKPASQQLQENPKKENITYLDSSTQSRYEECIFEFLRSPSGLGLIRPGESKHFYSAGAFNLIQLVIYLLSQTGSANVFLSTYSISQESLSALKRLLEKGDIASIRFLIDNRVRTISPIPFDQLRVSFPDMYRSCALHAKVALIWNEDWEISVVGSQNATHNPKIERGIIHTEPAVWQFDYKMLNDAFNSGAT